MVLRILTLIAATFLGLFEAFSQEALQPPSIDAPSSPETDFSNIVVPITSIKISPSIKMGFKGRPAPGLGVGAAFGTGFCLDPRCHFIATNYHVAVMTKAHKVKRERVVRQYLATGPQDEGATPNYVPNAGVVAYAKKRDLAIFELRHALPRHHGLAFSLDELEVGQQVDIYGYPKGKINPKRTLICFPATFKAPTTSGLLAFDYQLSSDKPIRVRGASGGIVVDRKTQKIVGIMSETTETMALAVPVRTLADFVRKVQPFMAEKLFPSVMDVSPLSADLYAKFVPPLDFYGQFKPDRAIGLQHRPQEPHEITALREKAQSLADSIRNFIAVQSYEWGTGDKEPELTSAYEVRVVDGVQSFRRYPEGKDELREVPNPHLRGWTTGSDEWSLLPKMVGTEFRLKVQQAPDVVINDKQMKVFRYYSSVEDNLCPFSPVEDFGFFEITNVVAVACYGEVWTDEDTNIIRISLHLDLSEKLKVYRGWESHREVVTYGLLKRKNEPQRAVPQTIFVEATDKKHVYWCRGQFTDYRVFGVRSRLLSADSADSPTTEPKP